MHTTISTPKGIFYFDLLLKMKLLPVFRLAGWLGLLAVLPACEKDITDKVNIDLKPQLVVSAFISPQDTVLRVKVSQSEPIIGTYPVNQDRTVTNATVQLTQGDQAITFTYNANLRVYEADPATLPVLAGQTYTLLVTTPDGYRATATSTVPTTDGVVISGLKHAVRRVSQSDGYEYDEHTFSYQWQDAPGRENFYHAFAERETYYPQENYTRWEQLYDGENYFTDDRRDGQLLAVAVDFSDQPNPEPFFLHVYVAVTDRDYYLYHQSVEKQQQTEDNPFAEPVLIYTNVTGGLGIFAAYNQVKAVLRVE